MLNKTNLLERAAINFPKNRSLRARWIVSMRKLIRSGKYRLADPVVNRLG